MIAAAMATIATVEAARITRPFLSLRNRAETSPRPALMASTAQVDLRTSYRVGQESRCPRQGDDAAVEAPQFGDGAASAHSATAKGVPFRAVV